MSKLSWQSVIVFTFGVTAVTVLSYFGKPTEALYTAIAFLGAQAFQKSVLK